VAFNGSIQIDQQTADNKFGHGVVAIGTEWYRAQMVCFSGTAVKPCHPWAAGPKMAPMEANMATKDTARGTEHRRRLLQAMASVAALKGVAAVTIADVVREAGVSKRTFYEHFDSKEACFLALYRAVGAGALKTLQEAVSVERPWQLQLEQALQAYLSHIAANPELLRTLFIEIHQLGAPGERARREILDAMADFMVQTLRREPGSRSLDEGLALAAVGGINELILRAIERGQASELPRMTATASEVVRRLARDSQP
jgi:AcrR family transcriptional regulator